MHLYHILFKNNHIEHILCSKCTAAYPSLKNIFKFINYICLDDKVRYDFCFWFFIPSKSEPALLSNSENKIHFGKKNSLGNWIELWWNVHFSWIAISKKIQNFEISEEWTEMEINCSQNFQERINFHRPEYWQ